MPPSDEQLYTSVLQGDQAALTALVERYHGALLRYLYRQTGHTQTAEDLVQETFIRLITYRGAPPRAFKAWAYTIATNLARDYFRSAVYRREWTSPDGAPEDEQRGEETDGRYYREAEGVLESTAGQALQRLPPEQREVLALRFYHDLRLEDIAQICGAPLGTIKSRLYQALRKLKALVEEEVHAHE